MCYINETWIGCAKWPRLYALITSYLTFAWKTSGIICITTCGTLSIFDIQVFHNWEDVHTNCYLSYSLSSRRLKLSTVNCGHCSGALGTGCRANCRNLDRGVTPWYSRLFSRCLVCAFGQFKQPNLKSGAGGISRWFSTEGSAGWVKTFLGKSLPVYMHAKLG